MKKTRRTPTKHEASWAALLKTLKLEDAPKVAPGVEKEIESDLTGSGGSAIGRRIGTAYLTQPFRKTLRAMKADPRTAEAFREAARSVKAAAKAHRRVAELLEMAHARLMMSVGEAAGIDFANLPKIENQRAA
jgi:hypothetical protein